MKILKFYSPTCGPCKVMEKNMKAAGIEYTDIDTTTEAGIHMASQFGVRSLPTVIKVDSNGTVVDTIKGIKTTQQLKEWYENN